VTRVGVAYGSQPDAFERGRSVARAALDNAGIEQADLVLAFARGQSDLNRFYDGLRAVVGDATPIVGGAGIGVIATGGLSYHGHPAAAAAIQSDSMRFAVSACGGLDVDEARAGAGIVDGLRFSDDARALLLFYDSGRLPGGPDTPPVRISSAMLLEGVDGRLSGRVPVVGAGLVGSYAFEPTPQFCGSRVAQRHAVGCLVSGRGRTYHALMHGCIPIDGVYRTITRMEGDVVHELDGRPVVEIVNELYGGTDWQSERPIIRNLTIGVNLGDRYGPPLESHYVNRLITGVSADGAGIGIFEADLRVGQDIQFMVRDNRMMMRSVTENVPVLLERVRADGCRPLLALYINCGGRTAEYSATEGEEAAIVQDLMKAAGVPLLGFYSGAEIAPVLGRSRGLEWTGLLLVLAED
jgi:small ligand-binding sensory domain FIST